MKRLFILVTLLAFLPILTSAHGDGYLEFNPDYFKTKSLNVSTAGTIYQIFLPSNEFLGGVDFWFDNAGSSGTLSFELRDKNNNIVTSKNVTIPHINPVSGGQRVHVDFNSQISVIGNDVYKIRISTNVPELQIYYSDRIKFLGHNEPHISDYMNGAAEVDGEEQQFSFKYTLYETNETSAPIISNIGWVVVSEDQMRVDFNTNEPVDYKLEYGPSGQGYVQITNFLGDYQFCTQGVLSCNISITVSPDTTYQYRLTVKDSWGNQSQATGTFVSGEGQTPAPTPSTSLEPTPMATATPTPAIDIIPPVISNLRIADVTNDSVDIAWTTDTPANSYLVISFTSDLITIAAASDPTFELEHLLKIEGQLNPNTIYLARVTSRDLSDNPSIASISFKTLGLVQTPLPTPSSSTPPQQPSPTITTTVTPSGTGSDLDIIQWGQPASGEPSDGYRVDIFDKEGNFIRTINISAGSHSTEILDSEKGEYSVIVYANNGGVYEKIAKPANLQVDDNFWQRLLALWPYLLIVVGLIVGLAIWKMIKGKASQAPQTPVS